MKETKIIVMNGSELIITRDVCFKDNKEKVEFLNQLEKLVKPYYYHLLIAKRYNFCEVEREINILDYVNYLSNEVNKMELLARFMPNKNGENDYFFDQLYEKRMELEEKRAYACFDYDEA